MSKNYHPENTPVDLCCDEINNIILGAGRLCLVRKRRPRFQKSKPDKLGFDQECRSLKNQVLRLGRLVNKFPKDPQIYGSFISKKKKFKSLVKCKYRQMREKLLGQIVNSQHQNPQLFWKLMKKLKESKHNDNNPISLDEWANYFKVLHNIPLAQQSDKKFVTQIKESVNMMNILKYEIVPAQWASGFIVPIHKGGSAMITSNYRGISITSSLGKLFTSIINERLYNFMTTKNILHPAQIGFMKGKRTSDHIFVLKCIIEEAKSKRKPIYACFVDLKKAFDTVWRDGLYYKLFFDCGMSSKFVNVMRSLYNNVTGSVKLHNGGTSNEFDISIGLRQGCNLSPYLFNLYINDLCKILDQANIDPVSLKSKKNQLFDVC